MCVKKQFKYCPSTIDTCMKKGIEHLNRRDVKTLASCCGHGRYPMTIVMFNGVAEPYELFSMKTIPRKKRFYRKDKDGYYYIPEVSEEHVK